MPACLVRGRCPLLVALVTVLFVFAGSSSAREPVVRSSKAVDLIALRAAVGDARMAAVRLRALGPMPPDAAAQALRAAGYSAREVEPAVEAAYRLSAEIAAKVVGNAFRQRLVVERNPALARGAVAR